MKKKTVYCTITPIPSHIPRQLAIDMLHSHVEMIELNPLVTGVKPIKAPPTAPPDEFFSTWYEISERIQYVPGMGRFGSGKISFNGCFHDMPWGLQTHTYAPMGIDMRNKWQIRGNQPGEPAETKELGSGAPAEGLYLREDIEIKCNPAMVSFVKKEMKAASKTMVERLVKKAELIDSGVLSAMMEDGKLKTINPADRSQTFQSQTSGGHYSPSMLSPAQHSFPPQSPGMYPGTPGSAYPRQSAYGDPRMSMHGDARQSSYGGMRQSSYQQTPPPQGLAIEMPGDTHFIQDSNQPQQQQQNRRDSTNPRFSSAVSELSASSPQNSHFPGQSGSSDRHSYATSETSHPSSFSQRMSSPAPEKRSFAAELPGNNGPVPNRSPRSPDPNSIPEYQQQQHQQQPQQQNNYQRYNPNDYSRMS
jgi:hypothetical protein